VTLIVDGLDELNADLKSETGAPGSNRSLALSRLLYDGIYKNLHCVVAGRPYSIVDDNWIHLFHFNAPGLQYNGGSEWEFCLAALFTPDQSKRYLGQKYDKLGLLLAQTPLTPRHLEVIRTLPGDRFANLHSLACVYWEMLQASLKKDLTREGNVGPFERLNVPVTKEQYIGYLAALASITMARSKDLKTLDLAEHEVTLQNRVLKIPSWKIGKESTEEKIKHIKGLNSSSIEFNYLQQSNSQVVWKDRTVMDFFAALWLVRYSTDQQRAVICKQVPRRGEKYLHENRRDLWTFIVGMPFDAFEKFDNLRRDARWLRLVHRLFQPFTDAKRPTQLMYVAWEEFKRGLSDQRRKKSMAEVMGSFTKQYQDQLDGNGEVSKIIRDDLESQFNLIPPPVGGWSFAVTTLIDNKDKTPITVSGSYEVCAYPVTRRMYAIFDRVHEVVFGDDITKYSPEPRCPVIHISWYDAMMFAVWAGGRLLKEHEWEYACRANTREVDPDTGVLYSYFWKDDPERKKLADHSWIGENSKHRTWPVDSKEDGSHTNPFGLVDMLGNVWEWIDSIHEVDSVSPVLRGMSFIDDGRFASALCRFSNDPRSTYIYVGFRIARAP
jgi:formylglycine-generating enzyme required for sulfatase activity